MLFYPAAITLSTRTLSHLAGLLRGRRAERGSRWRRLTPARQASLVLAHLRNGDTYARLASGFGIGTTTDWRYVREAVDLLAALADDLKAAIERAARLAYVILDGTLIPIDRLADDKPYYSGKHHRHGANVQVLADPVGRLVAQPHWNAHPNWRSHLEQAGFTVAEDVARLSSGSACSPAATGLPMAVR